MAFADFLISGSPSSALGLDAKAGDTLVLELASSPALDSARVVYSVVIGSLGAPAPTFDPPNGMPLFPSGQVKLALPAKGAHSYLVQCEVNDGRNARGQLDPAFTRQRIVAVRSALAGLRKMLPAESTQYDVRGWSDEQNREIDRVEEALASIGGSLVAGAGLTRTGTTIDVVAADASIVVGPDAIAVGVLQADTQHGARGGGGLHALGDAGQPGFLSPAHFALLAGATPAATPSTVLLRDAAGGASLAGLSLGEGGPALQAAGGGASIRTPNGLVTTIAAGGRASGAVMQSDVVVGTVATADENAATILSYALPDASVALLHAEILARAPATGDSAAYERSLSVKRHAGGRATDLGTTMPPGDHIEVPPWTASIELSGNEAHVRVTGAAGTDVRWFARLVVTLYAP